MKERNMTISCGLKAV